MKEVISRQNHVDFKGVKKNFLVFIKHIGKGKWVCRCDCGKLFIANMSDVMKKKCGTRSCGCMKGDIISRKNSTKRSKNIRLYKIYDSMKQRCSNPNNHAYKDYGGRGITVCVDWRKSYDSFYEWALSNGYDDTLTIERIDVNGDYEPSNCKWATRKEQGSNRRNSLKFEINGRKMTVKEISKSYNICETALYYRIQSGYSVNELIKPSGYFKNKIPKKKNARNKSGVTGVHWDKNNKKWVAQIGSGINKKHLGSFLKKEDAVKSRKKEEKLFFNE